VTVRATGAGMRKAAALLRPRRARRLRESMLGEVGLI
jgi:hypothetical protein